MGNLWSNRGPCGLSLHSELGRLREEAMTRPPDKYIAAAFLAMAKREVICNLVDAEAFVFMVNARAEDLHQYELNPPRVKCPVCPAMMVNPSSCMRSDCGFRK
jgi:hypothetical protein